MPRPTRNRKRDSRPQPITTLPALIPASAPLPYTVINAGFDYNKLVELLIERANDPLNATAGMTAAKMLLAELKEQGSAGGICPDPSAHVPRPPTNAAHMATTAAILAASGGLAWSDAQWLAVIKAAPAHLVTQLLLDQPTADESEAPILVHEDGSEIIDVTPIAVSDPWGWIGNRCERPKCNHLLLQHESGLSCGTCDCPHAESDRPAPQSRRSYEEGIYNSIPG
jgi:hypothetical protein